MVTLDHNEDHLVRNQIHQPEMQQAHKMDHEVL